jgi:hypothetical protein
MNEADRRVDFEDLDVDTWLSIGLLSWATRTRFKARWLFTTPETATPSAQTPSR